MLDEQVPLEVAPSSNVQTGAYPSLAAHPVDRLHRLGFAVTLNTDNRLMSGVSVTSELADVATHVRLVVGRRRRRSPSARWPRAFLPEAERARLLETSSGRGTATCDDAVGPWT